MRRAQRRERPEERRRRLGTLISLVVLLLIAGVAFATWIVEGFGQGAAQAGVVEDLVLTPGTPTDLLYPGGDPASVAVTVNNANTYAVLVTSLAQTTGEQITSTNPNCTPDIHGVTFSTANGSWLVGAGQTVDLILPGAASMSADSAADCQGSTFLIPLTATAEAGLAIDADADGVPVPDDCDDADPTVYPGAVEVLDGVDNNCDGTVDEGFSLFYADFDGDGYGDPNNFIVDVAAPAGYVSDGTDCDDANPTVNPGAPEVVGDFLDNDCDGVVDEVS